MSAKPDKKLTYSIVLLQINRTQAIDLLEKA